MSFTTNWNIEKPIAGALGWDVKINTDFDLIDSILEDIRTNYSSNTDVNGPSLHNGIGTLWYSTLQNPGIGLFVKGSTGYSKIMSQTEADARYIRLTGSTFNGTLTMNTGILSWFDADSNDFARLFLQTYSSHKNLTLEFGNTPSIDAFRINWNVGTPVNLCHFFSDKIQAFVPLKVVTATDATHAISKGQADSSYSASNHTHSIDNGSTVARPTGTTVGQFYFDITLSKPIWFNGLNWVDATGTLA